MKAAAILVLIYALGSGVWAINDHRNHEEARRDFAQQGITYLDFRTDSGKTVRFDTRKMETCYERHDATIGALSVISLIGSIVLFWSRLRIPVDVGR